MNQISTDGIVLSRVNYQDADRILTVVTPNNGKLSLLAKGIRRSKSKLAGSVELLSTTQITFLPGKGGLGTLISARLIKHYGNIVKVLDRTQLAYQLLKLVNDSTQEEAVEEIYDLLTKSLELLDDLSIDINLVKVWFGLNFLNVMGHVPDLDTSLINTEPGHHYDFDLNQMRFTDSTDGIYSSGVVKLFRLSLYMDSSKLHNIKNSDEAIEQSLRLVKLVMITNGFQSI
jgi:DNA repair protein RecO